MNDSQYQQSHQTKMLTFARDLPNICSLVGLLCAVLAIYYAVLGNFPAAIIGIAVSSSELIETSILKNMQ